MNLIAAARSAVRGILLSQAVSGPALITADQAVISGEARDELPGKYSLP
jgi:hypothetical protein